MDAVYSFVPFIMNTEYKDIPERLVFLLKDDILDTLGNMLVGSTDPVFGKVLKTLQEIGSNPEATVFMNGSRLSAGDAAMVNGCMAFSFDYDDICEPARIHFGCSAIPCALAVSEWQGNVSGKQLITALAVALELGARLGKYMERRNPTQVMGGWDYTYLHGCLTCAVVAGKLMHLNEEQMYNALGIAFHQCAGTSVSAMDNAHTKILSAGLAARTGIFSARLAKNGVTGARNIFNGAEISMAKQYHNGCDDKAITSELGTRWDALELGFKAYPCCRLVHRHIDAALENVIKNGYNAEQIAKVSVTGCRMVGPMMQTSEQNITPKVKLEAQFSIPWVVSCALVRGKVALDEFSPEAFSDAAIVSTAAKIESAVDSKLNDLDEPADITVTLTDGRSFTTHTGKPYGSHENPISHESLLIKFYDCAAHSVKSCTAQDVSGIVSSIDTLDCAENVGTLIAELKAL